MPNIRSAAKRARTSEKRRIANRAVISRIATVRQQFLDAVAGGDKAKGAEKLRQFFSVLDSAAHTNVIRRNNADRSKARAAKRLAALDRTA